MGGLIFIPSDWKATTEHIAALRKKTNQSMELENFQFFFLIFMRERGGGLVAIDGLFM